MWKFSKCAKVYGLLFSPCACAVTGRRCPHSQMGEVFLQCRTGPLTKNGRNLETTIRKTDPKVPKRPQRQGLQMRHWQKSVSYSKEQIFRPKAILGWFISSEKRIFGPFFTFWQNEKNGCFSISNSGRHRLQSHFRSFLDALESLKPVLLTDWYFQIAKIKSELGLCQYHRRV